MCAIFGYSGKCSPDDWHKVRRLLHELFVASAIRGTDAAGFAAIGSRGSIVTDKEPLPGPLFSATSKLWLTLPPSPCVIGHCRAATHGSPLTGDNRNNHPFVGRAGQANLAVVVNGVAQNHHDVALHHHLALRTECDSEVVLRLAEAADHPAIGLAVALSELRGGTAAAVLDGRRKTIWVARNAGRPAWLLEVDRLPGRLFASTEAIAVEAHRRAYQGQPKQPIRTLVPIATDVVIGLSAAGPMTVAATE
jgi:glucosamine 6-phosphate synthetase-like amidotransferase/phosphosugar isomerase protein